MPSEDAEASNTPSGENDTELTASVCPSSVAIVWRVATSHNFTVLSEDAEASNTPSGENDTDKILYVSIDSSKSGLLFKRDSSGDASLVGFSVRFSSVRFVSPARGLMSVI